MDDIALLLTETNNSPACQDPATTTPAPESTLDPTIAHSDRGDLDDAELTAWLDLAG